jgi:hypothetical protein
MASTRTPASWHWEDAGVGVIGRSVLLGARAGAVSGVVYFVVIGALVAFGTVLGAGSASLLGLLLFVGAGVACGLGLGLAAGLVGGAALAVVVSRAGAGTSRVRLTGGLAAGGTVLALTALEQATGVVGLLAPDVTTVVVIPTAIAAAVGATSAPGLVAGGAGTRRRGQPKRPET